jgi:hypothetical protein
MADDRRDKWLITAAEPSESQVVEGEQRYRLSTGQSNGSWFTAGNG